MKPALLPAAAARRQMAESRANSSHTVASLPEDVIEHILAASRLQRTAQAPAKLCSLQVCQQREDDAARARLHFERGIVKAPPQLLVPGCTELACQEHRVAKASVAGRAHLSRCL